MSGDGPGHGEGRTGEPDPTRGRLTVALGGAVLLAAIIAIVVLTRESDEAPPAPTGTCFVAWNDDPIAPRQDGIHAYTEHGYRETLVTRLDEDGRIADGAGDGLEPDDPKTPCAVIFASPQVDDEPDFGVRVFAEGRWTGLALARGTELEDIASLQAEAVAASNAVLAADGTLAED